MGGTSITTDGSRTYQSVNDPDWAFPRMHSANGVDFCRSETGTAGGRYPWNIGRGHESGQWR
jgi:hypothetical protein